MAVPAPRPLFAPGVDYNALHRALAQGIRARRLDGTTWQTTGSETPDAWSYFVVRLPDGTWRCTCPAGALDRGCKHSALCRVLALSGAVPAPSTGSTAPAASPGADVRDDPRDTALLACKRSTSFFDFADADEPQA